jgi:dUTP pyrophosphatase
LPEDYEMEIRPRSSITKTKSVIQNAPGTVDEGYRGEIMVACRRVDCYDDPSYSVGDKVAQLLIRRRERIVWDQVKSLDDLGYTDRGDGGFGSTGR